MRRLLVGAALGCFVGWAGWVGLVVLRMATMRHGIVPGWLELHSPIDVAVDVIRGASMITCWFGSFYVWANGRSSGVLHALALVGLIFLGMIVGPFYILLHRERLSGSRESSKEEINYTQAGGGARPL